MPEYKNPSPQDLSHSQHMALRALCGEYRIVMLNAMYWRNRSPWDLGMRVVHDSFFLFPVRGAVRLTMSDGERVLRPGDFLMLPEGRPHHLRILEGHDRLDQIALHCYIYNRWHLPLLSRFSSHIGKLTNRSAWFRQLKTLVTLLNSDAEAGQTFGESLLRLLLSGEMIRGNELTPQTYGSDPRVERVQQYLRQHYADSTLSVEQAAREVNLSPVQMRKLFLRYSGMSPKEHLNQIRMLEAARLLRQTVMSVKEIAGRSGFNSDHYFHLAFRKEHGCTPSEYRDRVPM